MTTLGMVGQGPARGTNGDFYKNLSFDQLVSRIEELRVAHTNQAATIIRLQIELADLKLKGAASWIAEGRSPLEVKLADENRVLRQDLRSAREQLISLRSLLKDFENTPVNVPNVDLGIDPVLTANAKPVFPDTYNKTLNEELLQRLREEDRQRARRQHRERIQRDIEDWVAKFEASAKARIERLERMEKRLNPVKGEHPADPWADGQFGIADQERGIDPMASQYAVQGPAQEPAPPTPDTSTDAFIRSIMPKGC